tara:strand:+ start:83 stop:415 length:333 start_codon:yes stop_codon:yes gene_type:complete
LSFLDAVRHHTVIVEDLLIKKRAMYGDKNFKKRGVLGVVIRLEDKVARLDALLASHGKPVVPEDVESVPDDRIKLCDIEEGLDDVFKDIAGYAVAALMLIEGTWEENGNV